MLQTPRLGGISTRSRTRSRGRSEPDLRAFSAHFTCITCALFVHLVCIPTLPCNVSGQVCVMCVFCASYAHSKALLRTIVAFVSILPRPERKRIQCRPGPGRRECAPTATPPGVGCTSLLRMRTHAHECTKRGAPWHLANIGGQSAECAKSASYMRNTCSEMRMNARRKNTHAP